HSGSLSFPMLRRPHPRPLPPPSPSTTLFRSRRGARGPCLRPLVRAIGPVLVLDIVFDLQQSRRVAAEDAAHVGRVHAQGVAGTQDRKSTRLNSSHVKISYAVFCVKKKTNRHR